MERTQLFDLMGELKLYGMKAAFDEIMATAVKRQHEPQRIIGDLLAAEISEKQARSIKYQLTIAKLPLAKDLDDFQFEGTPINETLVRDLASGDFVAQQRNAVLVGGTGTGKTHLAIAIKYDVESMAAPKVLAKGADLIAKAACGICDDLLTTVLCATTKPVVLAPSMNVNMWENPITQENCTGLTCRIRRNDELICRCLGFV